MNSTETRMNSPTLSATYPCPIQAFREAGIEPPNPDAWIERRAKLFHAGDFPDKGLTITHETLVALVSSFSEPVPVLIEHAESPLELGYLTSVEASGDELFGTISLTPEANALVERSGARGLSLGLNGDLNAIREVSLVRNPRVADARLFFAGALDSGVNWQEQYEHLERQVRQETAEREARSLMQLGKLTPAQMPFAVALLQSDDHVTFGGKKAPVGRLVRQLIDVQPGIPMFRELAPEATQEAAANLLLPEEAEFYRRYFPGVSLDQIAAKR